MNGETDRAICDFCGHDHDAHHGGGGPCLAEIDTGSVCACQAFRPELDLDEYRIEQL